MEKKDSKVGSNLANLKLTFLDLFPSYEEIDENNDGIIIIFQNCNLTYNLIELIKNREEIFVPQQIPNQTIKINLLKSNNPYATGSFTIKSGEQWITFNYEHKKKQASNFALSLIDCIKIKFLCKIDYIGSSNNQLTNTEIQTTKNDSILANILTKPSPKKLYGNFTTKKSGHTNNNAGNNIKEHDSLRTEESKISKMLDNINPEIKNNNTNNNLNNTTLNSSKNTNNPLLKSENLSEFSPNPLASSSGVVGKDFKGNEKNKNKNAKRVYNNNLNTNSSLNLENKKSSDIASNNQKKKNKNNETLTKEKTKGNNSTSNNNVTNTIDNKNMNENKSKQNLKRNKSKNLMDNKNKTNKKEKQTKNVTYQNNSNNNLNNNSEQKPKKVKKDSSSKNVAQNKEEKEIEDDNNNIINNIEKSKDEENIENINIDNNNDNLIDNNKDEINDMDITNKIINNNYDHIEKDNEPLLDDENDELDNFGLDNFSKKLEDFQLLYNDEYIKSIKEEDYSLEIELYIEKLIELITEYHIQIEEKDLEYQLIKNMYQKNIYEYLEINKLIKKLELIKDDYNLKKNNPKPIYDGHDKNYINNLITNKVEINMFNFILFSQKEKDVQDKKEQLKKILKNILNKPKNKGVVNQNEKIMKWIQTNMNKQNQGKDKGKKKGKQQQKNQPDNKDNKDNKDKGVNKNDKKKKNTSNSPSKSKNKFNKNVPEEKGKKK